MANRIGRYEVQDELGRGGFGRVFRAFDPSMGSMVAIKILAAGGEPDLLIRFRNEAAAARKLQQKNIVTVYDFGEEDGVPYIVMELLDGEDLQRVIANHRPLTALQKMRIMSQVAEGLHYAHLHGVVHRDVKPANIMLLSDDSVKIMDFGIAKVAQATGPRALDLRDLTGAYKNASEALQMDPGNSKASVLLKAVLQEKSTRERERRLQEGISRAKGLLMLQAFDEAIGLLLELRATKLRSEAQENQAAGVYKVGVTSPTCTQGVAAPLYTREALKACYCYAPRRGGRTGPSGDFQGRQANWIWARRGCHQCGENRMDVLGWEEGRQKSSGRS